MGVGFESFHVFGVVGVETGEDHLTVSFGGSSNDDIHIAVVVRVGWVSNVCFCCDAFEVTHYLSLLFDVPGC